MITATTIVLPGEINFSNAMIIYQKISEQKGNLEIDFSRVRASNSVGLALILECLKLAKQKNVSIKFYAIPTKLLAIAKCASLEEFIQSAVKPLHS
jgi:ABC-type transporter Mla MlaB component